MVVGRALHKSFATYQQRRKSLHGLMAANILAKAYLFNVFEENRTIT